MAEGEGPATASERQLQRLADELREHGHRLIDRMADHVARVSSGPVSTSRRPAELAARFAEPLPRVGTPAAEVWDRVFREVVADAIHFHHPLYAGHQVAPPLPHAVLADALASLLNNSLAVWEMSPTGTPMEGQVVRWLVSLLGFPDDADGTFVSGGSAANLTALLAAREAKFPGAWRRGVAATPGAERAAVFVGANAHYSVERAVAIAGFGADAVIPVAERDHRMDPLALHEALGAAKRAGRVPVAVVATAGSTATGLIDDLSRIADVAEDQSVWLHVDGAHGASFLCSPKLAPRLAGISRADSVAWDMHKMMWMPLSAGAILMRDRGRLAAAFQQSAPYLFHPAPGESCSRDLGERTLQCSRRFDALKVWISLQVHGADHFAALQESSVAATRHLHRLIEAAPDFEAGHEPESNILCFRYRPPTAPGLAPEELDDLQLRLRSAYNASGDGWITAAVLAGRRYLRVTLMNTLTDEAHLARLVAQLREVGERCGS
jgi:L-2,4-diaminobutyrate decarboxylase